MVKGIAEYRTTLVFSVYMTILGAVMLTIFAGLSQFERECTLQRQAEGIAIAKAEGKYKGRKPISKPADWDYVIGLYKAKEITAVQAQNRLGLSRATFYRMLNKSMQP